MTKRFAIFLTLFAVVVLFASPPVWAGGGGPGCMGTLCGRGASRSDLTHPGVQGNPAASPRPRALYEEKVRKLLGLPKDVDFSQKGKGPALIIVGDPKAQELDLPEWQGDASPFLEAAGEVAQGLIKEGISPDDFAPVTPTSVNENDPKAFDELMQVAEDHPEFFKKIAIIAHSTTLNNKSGEITGVYAQPNIGGRGLSLTADQIKNNGVMVFGCGAKVGGMTYGQAGGMARRYGETGNYQRALSQTVPAWRQTAYGAMGMAEPR